MPGLFSRRSKAKEPLPLATSKAYFGAVSSADIDRLGLSSPTPSTADAHLLPTVPTKDDIPPPPPKHASYVSAPSPLQPITNNAHPTPHLSPSSLSPTSTNVNDFGPMLTQNPSRPSTFAVSSQSTTASYLQPPSTASTLAANRRLASTGSLYTVSSASQFDRPKSSSSSAYESSSCLASAVPTKSTYLYGYTTEACQDHLSAVRVLALLEACAQQIRSRGLDNPLIFSSMALDLSPSNVASLIRNYSTSAATQASLPPAFLDELRYANPHDLAATIKWAFARMGRVLAVPVPLPGSKKGEMREEMVYVHQRGFLDLETYNAWREQERRHQYPATAFRDFLSHLAPENVKLLSSLFSLLSSTASYSFKNGMMPAKLCKHFGPLLFGLPEDETFARTYDAYVRASNATEHLLLAYIRFQATTTSLPPRLAQHINGYPSMLPAEMTLPSASSKLVPVTQIERNVRLYSVDLVQSACEIDLTQPCPEWQDCRDTNEALGKDPQLSDKFRKLVNLRGGAVQGRKRGSANTRDASTEDDDALAAHSSLVSKQWGDFMSEGFSAPDSSKLAFDLNESARRNRTTRRETRHWNEFSQAGFQDQENDNLADVLSFDHVLKQDVHNWPSDRDQLGAKLKARQNKLPAFDYDTTPRLLTSPTLAGTPKGKSDNHPISRMDETFADVWADYLLGSGWSNRDELTHRNANFVVVQYKSRPNASTVGSQSAGSSLSAPTRFQVSARKDESVPKDERVDAAWFVIQEVVPAQYRADLEATGRGTFKGLAMIRKFTMFRSRKDKDKSNGNESTCEDAPTTADDVFQPGPGGSTKRIFLSDQLKRNMSKNASQSTLRSNRTSVDHERPSSALAVHDSNQPEEAFDATASSNTQSRAGAGKLMSTLRSKSIRVVKSARRGASSPALKHAAAIDEFGTSSTRVGSRSSRAQHGDVDVDRSFTSADFETRSVATDGEDNASLASSSGAPKRKPSAFKAKEGAKRQTGGRDDAWIDIMVKANNQRMHGQDAPFGVSRKTWPGQASTDMDEAGQLSVSEAQIGGSARSDESLDEAVGDGPRSSTPPLHIAKRASTANLGELMDATHSRSCDFAEPSADSSSGTPRADASDMAMRDASLGEISHTQRSSCSPPRAASLKPGPPIDAVAAARAALKSRKQVPTRPAPQIDTKKLVESLRAGLSPIEAVRASKGARGSAFPQVANGSASGSEDALKSKAYRNVFAKDPVAGRVADVASKFGGSAAAGGSAALAESAARSGIPEIKRKPLGEIGDKPLAPAPAPVPAPAPASAVAVASASDVADETDAGLSVRPGLQQRDSIDSTCDPDEIYPEDAASNFDPKDHASRDSPLLCTRALDTDHVEHLAHHPHQYSWRSNQALPQPDPSLPSRFTQPYQPGMPLDNVLEESESVLSSSTNL